MALSNKQKAAAHEYIKDWNLTRALISAGYSVSYANAQGYKMLENVGFKEFVKEIQKDMAKEAGISMLSQILELKKVAYSNIAGIFKEWTKLEDLNNLTTEQKGAIMEISHKKHIIGDTNIETEFVKLKLHDKLRAIQEINKMLGYYEPEKIDHNIKTVVWNEEKTYINETDSKADEST